MRTRDDARRSVLTVARRMHERGLVAGTAGNVSARAGDGTVVVTPSSVDYSTMGLDDLVVVAADGSVVAGDRSPTSELILHLSVLAAFSEVGGVVHTHARHASMFAVAHRPIPAAVDEFVVHVGGDVAVIPYQESGSEGLAHGVTAALTDRSAVLMANHGLVTIGPSVDDALRVTLVVEHNAAVVWGAAALGGEVALPAESVARFAGVYEYVRRHVWVPVA